MKCNLAWWDRIIRFILGVVLLTLAFSGGPYWFYLGFYFLFTSAWGICPLYGWFNFKTLKLKKKNINRVAS